MSPTIKLRIVFNMAKLLKRKGPRMSRSHAKRQTATETLMDRLAELVDKKYDDLGDSEIGLSQQKLRSLRDRVRASHAPKRETA